MGFYCAEFVDTISTCSDEKLVLVLMWLYRSYARNGVRYKLGEDLLKNVVMGFIINSINSLLLCLVPHVLV